MRWLIGLLLVSVVLAAGEKKVEKRPTKKAHSSKPTKTPKSIVEEFTALPPSDVDFIKELDRQFREHGNKIRIKVERSNGTDGKNIKRTIEGDLGYGHYSNQAETGYHFSKPKYMIYPYSQHDIPPVRSTHSTAETVTDIEITPSHSYELKPIEEVYQVYPTQQYSQEQQQHYYHHHQQEQSQHQAKQLYQQEDAPVIVLKIPGPSKYAAHLQALLQQYLEVRAAQLYKELEEHELQQQQQQQQHHHQQQQHQLQHQQQLVQQHYVQEQEPASHQHHHHPHQQQQQEQHTKTKYSQPDPVYPTEIAYVPMIRTSHNTYLPLPEQYYDTPKAPTARPTKRPNYRKTTVTPTHVTFHSTVQPEPAYHYQTYHPEQQHHAQVHDQGHTQIQYQYVAQQPTGQQGEDHEAHYVYSKPVVNFVTPLPDGGHHGHADPYQHQQQQHHHQPAQKYPNFAEYHHHHRPQQQQEEDYLPEPKLVENYPSHKHTRVVYKSPSLKAELQQEAAMEQHDHYHHHHQLEQQQQQQQDVVHHLAHHQEQQQQHQYILQEVYPSQASYFEDKSFVESAGPQETTDRSETASPHYNTEEVVAITQKPKRLYNYHAHSSGHGHGGGSRGSRMAAASGSRSRASGSGGAKATGAATKRDTTGAPYTEDEFRKVNKMVQRLKKKSRTTVDDSGMTTVGLSVSSTSPSPRMGA
uniref:Uncharacterized protein n=1 Tax=Anopheles atroparvus TaxID=41427 RepID=A0AAG5CT12_ANOAO